MVRESSGQEGWTPIASQIGEWSLSPFPKRLAGQSCRHDLRRASRKADSGAAKTGWQPVVPHSAPPSSLSPGTPLGRTEVAASADSSGRRRRRRRSFEILSDPCCDSAVGAHNFFGIEGAILDALRKQVVLFMCYISFGVFFSIFWSYLEV